MNSRPAQLFRTTPETGASLELKLVGDISGQFHVARYQRGYRWGEFEVEHLLEDIWNNEGRPYSLQPVVVKRLAESEWELIDGQQRLTTLYLVFRFMQNERLQNAAPPYTISYNTRPGSGTYLQGLGAAQDGTAVSNSAAPDCTAVTNIDFFHLCKAYHCIKAWFDRRGAKRQFFANEFYGYLYKSVSVIWYEAPANLDATTLFTRLNVGRIPLTDAELVKALLLSRSRGAENQTDRAYALAAQWDGIERDLHHPDVWAFVTGAAADDCPTRISLLLDTLAGGIRGRERKPYLTFETLRQQVESASPQALWDRVLDLHALVLWWFENRHLYHKIGYLVAVGDRTENTFGDLVALAAGRTKSSFEALLDQRIRDTLALSAAEAKELSYETKAGYEKCERLLLLMNVETVRRMKDSTERYSFRSHGAGDWSLEHIHAQHAETLTKVEQWQEWLRLHCAALRALPGVDEQRRDALVARIAAAQGNIDRQSFPGLARDVTDIFTLADQASSASLYSEHSISNLALLSSDDNSALGNAVFEVKRRRILELDREGKYIPICTRQVFLKYFTTDTNAQQIHFWSMQDREHYLTRILDVLKDYLKPEDRQS